MGGWLGGWVGGVWRVGAGEETRKEASDVVPNNVLIKATGILYIEKQQLIKDCLCERSVMVYETKRPPSPFEKFL